MTDLRSSPLARAATYPDRLDPGLLFPVDRAPQREELGFGVTLPFRGVDLWTAYELSWLDAAGRPEVAIATFAVPADSPRIVESKSVKLYLAGFNLNRFAAPADVVAALSADLSGAVGAAVGVSLAPPHGTGAVPQAEFEGTCLDALPLAIDNYLPDPAALAAAEPQAEESLHTRLFRSVCPVTGQPDYACVQVRYRGPRIDHAGLLRYLVSYRRHPGFHEHCVERIFADLWRRCRPEALSVYARFTRRGGIDINPWRSSEGDRPPFHVRTARQ